MPTLFFSLIRCRLLLFGRMSVGFIGRGSYELAGPSVGKKAAILACMIGRSGLVFVGFLSAILQ